MVRTVAKTSGVEGARAEGRAEFKGERALADSKEALEEVQEDVVSVGTGAAEILNDDCL